jgi:hypothetical protein
MVNDSAVAMAARWDEQTAEKSGTLSVVPRAAWWAERSAGRTGLDLAGLWAVQSADR